MALPDMAQLEYRAQLDDMAQFDDRAQLDPVTLERRERRVLRPPEPTPCSEASP
jgi:hypothetical protein